MTCKIFDNNLVAMLKSKLALKFNRPAYIRMCTGSECSSYEIKLQNRVTQNDATFRVPQLDVFIETLLASY